MLTPPLGGEGWTIGGGIVAPPCWEPAWEPGIAFLGSATRPRVSAVLGAPSGMPAVLLQEAFPRFLTAQGPVGVQRWKAQSSPVVLRANTLRAPIVSSVRCKADSQHFLDPTFIVGNERSCFQPESARAATLLPH